MQRSAHAWMRPYIGAANISSIRIEWAADRTARAQFPGIHAMRNQCRDNNWKTRVVEVPDGGRGSYKVGATAMGISWPRNCPSIYSSICSSSESPDSGITNRTKVLSFSISSHHWIGLFLLLLLLASSLYFCGDIPPSFPCAISHRETIRRQPIQPQQPINAPVKKEEENAFLSLFFRILGWCARSTTRWEEDKESYVMDVTRWRLVFLQTANQKGKKERNREADFGTQPTPKPCWHVFDTKCRPRLSTETHGGNLATLMTAHLQVDATIT